MLCRVRQGGVLSSYLFSFYVNDIVEDLKNQGYGIYIGSIFLGCILYADDQIKSHQIYLLKLITFTCRRW